nr:F-box/WD40 repeat-containing protein [Endozoicomonas sp. ONNA2]
MVSDWPVTQPAKTTPFNDPSTVIPPQASRQTQLSPTKPPPTKPPPTKPLQQRRITELPPELLAMIFDYLEFDDIRQVNATCLAFREVVKEFNYIQELSYFARLPRNFREQYQHNAPRQKKSLEFHPFANSAPLNDKLISFRNRIIKNLPQMPALMCLATLGKMEPCPAYRLVKRYTTSLPVRSPGYSNLLHCATPNIRFSPSNRHLLFYGRCLNDSRLLARDDRGQWAEDRLNWSDNRGSRVITRANFTDCTNRLLTCSDESCVNTLLPAHRCWDDVGKVTLPDQTVNFSPSGNYMLTYNPAIIWRMDENNDWLKMDICGLSPGTLAGGVLFSPSEQHLVLYNMMGTATMLTLDDRGVWSAQQLISSTEDFIGYVRFSPMSNQLLVGFSVQPGNPGQVSIYRLKPSGEWEQTTLLPYFCSLCFSPGGKYVYGKYNDYRCHEVHLWRILEKFSDCSCNLCLPQLDAASAAGLAPVKVLKHDAIVEMAQFSPTDRHLLVHCGINTIIWGQSQAGEWSYQTITDECALAPIYCFSLSGLHVLTCNPFMVGILGCSDQKGWSLKGVIKQNRIIKACFNPLSEHEVVVLSLTRDGDTTNATLQVWEITDSRLG